MNARNSSPLYAGHVIIQFVTRASSKMSRKICAYKKTFNAKVEIVGNVDDSH